MKQEYETNKVRKTGARALEDLGYGRETDEKQLFFGLLGEAEARNFLEQYPKASRLQTYAGETSPTTPTALSKVGNTRLPTATAKAGSSLDLARQQAAGTISVEQQRALRDQLLNPKTPVKTTPTVKPVTPTSSVAPRSAITASTMPGTTLLQRAAARGAARLTSRST